jgi:ribokinase
MINLAVVGTIGLDDVETPFGKVEGALGGSGVYASCAASFFSKAGLISVAGDDVPQKYLNLLDVRMIDTKGVTKTGKTFRWSGAYEFDMNEAKTLKTELNSLAGFEPEVPDAYKDAKFVFLANIDPEVQLKVLEVMKNDPFVVTDTMNYWITSAKEKLLEVIKKTNLLVLNEGEVRQLFETPNLIKAGKLALKLGPQFVVIKKGEHGALLFSNNDYFSAPGYPLEEVKDPTGCGDSFAGGLIGYLASQRVSGSVTADGGTPSECGTSQRVSFQEVRKAIIYGSTIASFCAEDFSLKYLENISKKDIEDRYDSFKKIRQF